MYRRLTLVVALSGVACDSDKTKADPSAEASEKGEAKKEEVGAFDAYQRKSMSSEAMVSLSLLRSGVQAYLSEERIEPGSLTAVTGALPPSAPVTPPAGTCCKQPDGKCPTSLGDWSHEGWKALNFEPASPHRYSYEVVVEGKTVTVRAIGDLDCDGTYSTFERVGKVSGDEITFAAELTKIDPLE